MSDDVVVVGAAVVMVVCSGPEWSPVVLEVTDIDLMGLAPSALRPGVMGGMGVMGVIGVLAMVGVEAVAGSRMMKAVTFDGEKGEDVIVSDDIPEELMEMVEQKRIELIENLANA